MRVPLPIVFLLCLGVVGGVWWAETRDRDFLTAPSEHELALIRQKASRSLPPADHPDDMGDVTKQTAERELPKPASPKPAAHADDRPSLSFYRDQTTKDAASLAEQALQLEGRGECQKSLLVWERVVDSTAADETRTLQAFQAIKRLRAGLPEWDENGATAVTIHAGTGKTTTAILTPVLEEAARDLEQVSSGILKISSSVHAGHDLPQTGRPAPVALWLSGPNADSCATEVIVFTIGPPGTLREDVLKNLFKIIRSYLSRTTSLTVPEAIVTDEPPIELIQTHITRLGWLELGAQLNKSLE